PLALTLLELDKEGGRSGSIVPRFLTALRKSALKPIVLAPVAAVILVVSGLGPPAETAPGPGFWSLARSSLDLMARASAGAALFLTGLILSAMPHVINRNVVISVLAGNIVRPLLT